MKRIHSRIYPILSELFLDSEKLVILRDTLGSGRGTRLDLAGVEGNSEICDGRICGLAGAVRGNCCVAGTVCHLDRLQGLGYRTDLVQFDQDRVCAAELDSLGKSLCVCYKKVITD